MASIQRKRKHCSESSEGLSASDITLLAGRRVLVESKSHFNKNQTHGLEFDRSHQLGGCFTIFQPLISQQHSTKQLHLCWTGKSKPLRVFSLLAHMLAHITWLLLRLVESMHKHKQHRSQLCPTIFNFIFIHEIFFFFKRTRLV